jgi:hypothetical protein
MKGKSKNDHQLSRPTAAQRRLGAAVSVISGLEEKDRDEFWSELYAKLNEADGAEIQTPHANSLLVCAWSSERRVALLREFVEKFMKVTPAKAGR